MAASLASVKDGFDKPALGSGVPEQFGRIVPGEFRVAGVFKEVGIDLVPVCPPVAQAGVMPASVPRYRWPTRRYSTGVRRCPP
jgi:hypothetical protein